MINQAKKTRLLFNIHVDVAIFFKIAQAGCVLILNWFLVQLLAIRCNKAFNTA
jgi:hypothetical protein